MSKKQHVLVIASHPDDEVLGCGGSIVRHLDEGDSVAVLILGEGIASRAGLSEGEVRTQQARLKQDIKASHKILGVKKTFVSAFPDNQFDGVPLLAIVHEIEAVMNEVRPTLVYTHHASDTNVDHRVVAAAVDAAVRPMKGVFVGEVRAFEVPSSTEWNFTRPLFRPQVFVSLSERQARKKIQAMRKYKSEIRTFPHPRSSEYLEALARVRGGQSGFRAAEAFELVYRRV